MLARPAVAQSEPTQTAAQTPAELRSAAENATQQAVRALQSGDAHLSLDWTEKAVELYTAAGDEEGLRRARTDRGMLRGKTGNLPGAVEDLETVVVNAATTEDLTNLKWLSDIYIMLRRYDLAVDRTRRAYELAQTLGEMEKASMLAEQLAGVQLVTGQYSDALILLLDSARHKERLGLPALKTRWRIASAYALLGDERAAVAVLDEIHALAMHQNLLSNAAEAIEQKAIIHTRNGRRAEAILDQQDALRLRAEANDLPGRVANLRQLAAYYVDAGETSKAALSLHEAAGWERMIAPGTTKRHDADEVLSGPEVEAFRARTNASDDRRRRQREGLTFVKLGELEKAKNAFEEALVLARDAGAIPSEIMLLGQLGVIEMKLDRPDAALRLFRQGMDLAERVRRAVHDDDLQSFTQAEAFDVYGSAVDLLFELGRAEEAFHVSERSRARVFLDRAGGVRPAAKTPALRDLLDVEGRLAAERQQIEVTLAAAALGQAPSGTDTASLASRLDEIDRTRRELLTRINLLDAAAATSLGIEPPDLNVIRAALPPRTTLVSYFITSRAVYAFVIRPRHFSAHALPLTPADATRRIIELRSPAATAARRRELLTELRAGLLDPLFASLEGNRLAVVPHAVLHHVPFNAMSADPVGQPVHRLPSAGSLTYLGDRSSSSTIRVVAVSNASPAGRPILVHADEEVAAVGTLYGTAGRVVRDGGERVVREYGPNATVIHLAAHGDSRPDSPSLSNILLAPSAGDDGKLEAREILRLSLPRTRLVILSACETLLAPANHSDDALGLVDAFLLAGADGVVASLWRVDDAATRELMTAFHRDYRRSGDPGKALLRAQQAVRRQFPDPLTWAAFEISGGL